jgi:hypothetical protein
MSRAQFTLIIIGEMLISMLFEARMAVCTLALPGPSLTCGVCACAQVDCATNTSYLALLFVSMVILALQVRASAQLLLARPLRRRLVCARPACAQRAAVLVARDRRFSRSPARR